MAQMPDINRRLVGVGFKLELLHKIDKFAKEMDISRRDAIELLVQKGTNHIVLTSDDYEAIAKEVRENEKKREEKRIR